MKIKIYLIFCLLCSYLHASSCLYDEEGKLISIKFYIDSNSSCKPLIDFPLLLDEKGFFLTVMIQYEHWICPYCGILNPANISQCICPNCDSQKIIRDD